MSSVKLKFDHSVIFVWQPSIVTNYRYVIHSFHLKGFSRTNIKFVQDSTPVEFAPSFLQ